MLGHHTTLKLLVTQAQALHNLGWVSEIRGEILLAVLILHVCDCRVHKPGVPRDRLRRPGSAQENSLQFMGRPKKSKNNGPGGQTGRRPEGPPKERTPARQLLRPTSPIGALALGTSHLQAAFDRKAWPKTLLPTPTPRLRPGTRGKPACRSSPTSVARVD